MKGKHEEVQIVCDNKNIYDCLTNMLFTIMDCAKEISFVKSEVDDGYPQYNITFKYFLKEED